MNKTITAVSRQDDQYQGVVLRKKGHLYELLHLCSHSREQYSWHDFCRQINQADSTAIDTPQTDSSHIIVGFDSSRTAYYQITIPEMDADRMAAAIKIQNEAILPLPSEQMKTAWRTGNPVNGKTDVTIAAIRKDQYQKHLNQTKDCPHDRIILQSEAIIKAWMSLFGGVAQPSVVVYIGKNNTQILLSRDGVLSFGATSDVSRDDLGLDGQLDRCAAEQLAQDIYHIHDRLGDTAQKLPIYILSDQSETLEQIITYLNTIELNIETATPQKQIISDVSKGKPVDLSAEIVYQYLVPLGLALLAFDEQAKVLDIFDQRKPMEKNRKMTIQLPSLKYCAVAVLISAFLLVAVSYGLDVWKVKRIDAYLADFQEYQNQSETPINLSQWQKEQKTKKYIAAQRPDILQLLQIIQSCDPGDIMLDSIHCKKNQPVTMTAHTKNEGKMYDFQEKLQNHKSIKTVRIDNKRLDDKKKEYNFTITFEYKSFSKKRRK